MQPCGQRETGDHMALCVGAVLNAVVVGGETGEGSRFNIWSAIGSIKEPCAHHLMVAIMLLDVHYIERGWEPARVFDLIPAMMASLWSGDARC